MRDGAIQVLQFLEHFRDWVAALPHPAESIAGGEKRKLTPDLAHATLVGGGTPAAEAYSLAYTQAQVVALLETALDERRKLEEAA